MNEINKNDSIVITRKLEIFIREKDEDLRRQYLQKLSDNRHAAYMTANLASSSAFALDKMMKELNEESRKTIKCIGMKGMDVKPENIPYNIASRKFGKTADMGMLSTLVNNVTKSYNNDKKEGGTWKRSIRSYKYNIPMPFKVKRFTNFRFEDYINCEDKKVEGCFFTLLGIPFQIRFGKDHSGNRNLLKHMIDQKKFDEKNGKEGRPTGYRMCQSSIAFELKYDSKSKKKKQKMFLYLSLSIPKIKKEIDPKKVLYCYLSFAHPIVCFNEKRATVDEILSLSPEEWYYIGDGQQFAHRRIQIQEGLRRCRKACCYNKGGHGRKRKMQAVERYKEMENNYVDYMLHEYSKKLIDHAVKKGFGTIYLVDQKRREDETKKDNEKGDHLILRNWSYYQLKQKIKYKAQRVGITVLPKKNEDENGDTKEEYLLD